MHSDHILSNEKVWCLLSECCALYPGTTLSGETSHHTLGIIRFAVSLLQGIHISDDQNRLFLWSFQWLRLLQHNTSD